MAEQYFTADPTCESKQVPCSFVYRGHGLNFMTDAGVFSKGELDTGTRLLLDALPDVYGDVLDLGEISSVRFNAYMLTLATSISQILPRILMNLPNSVRQLMDGTTTLPSSTIILDNAD